MALADVTRGGVLKAIAEFDDLGRDAFLTKYGFGSATDYTLVYQGRQYDSKAIVGVAHKFDRPSEGVLASSSGFSGGKNGAAGRLEALNFEVEQHPWDPDYSREPCAWAIRAGGEGQAEKLALTEGCAVTGWSEVGELSAAMTREDLKAAIAAAYNDHNEAKLNSGAGRLFRFVNDVVEGDIVVLPLQTSVGEVAVGRVAGPYRYRPEFLDFDAVNTRAVDWFAPAVARGHFPEDLRSAFSQQGAISRISQPGAVDRLAAVAGGDPPAPKSWLFQAKPTIWDLSAALEVLPTFQWVTRQSFRQIRAGDTVHMYVTGPNAGVLARGRILTNPAEGAQTTSELVFSLTDELTQVEQRVWVAIDRVLDDMIRRAELFEHPVLVNLGNLSYAGSTNFDVKPEQELALRALEDERLGRDVGPEKLFFITAAGGLAAKRLQTSLIDGVALEQFAELGEIYPQLERHAVNGRVYLWGARPGQAAEKKWDRLNPGDVCLVYADGGFPLWGRVYAKARSRPLAREIWGEQNGETWDCMYFLYPVEALGADRQTVVKALDYKDNYIPQGFDIPREETQRAIRATHPTLWHFVRSLASDRQAVFSSGVWWVCQGKTYTVERDRGLMWAPKKGANGSTQEYWRALQDARVGDKVLHYANGAIRAVSTVTATAEDAPRPEGLRGDWEREGWLVRCTYDELTEPVKLADVPVDWRTTGTPPFTSTGSVRQGYFFPLSEPLRGLLGDRFPELGLKNPAGPVPADETPVGYVEPSFEVVRDAIGDAGLRLDEQTIRRYHVSLQTRGLVILSGLSGSGKTWLAQLYARAVGAEPLLVSVAPNWTANEDLLGYYDPLAREYRHTPFSRFLEKAAAAWRAAQEAGVRARPYHLILDEMNLARVEYYFAKFLSAMEVRSREETAPLELDAVTATELTPNLFFVGTVNVDETTHGFADKVYDRAQLIEIPVTQAGIEGHLAHQGYKADLLAVWLAVRPIAPFAYRVLDEIQAYVEGAAAMGVATDVAIDEQLLQKVLPKIKGTEKGIGPALMLLIERANGRWPLTAEKAKLMLAAYEAHGFTSFF
jgi:hypothetical protein